MAYHCPASHLDTAIEVTTPCPGTFAAVFGGFCHHFRRKSFLESAIFLRLICVTHSCRHGRPPRHTDKAIHHLQRCEWTGYLSVRSDFRQGANSTRPSRSHSTTDPRGEHEFKDSDRKWTVSAQRAKPRNLTCHLQTARQIPRQIPRQILRLRLTTGGVKDFM